MVPVDMPIGMRLANPNQTIEYLYFPVGGMISVDALTECGEAVEAGVIGREGCSGVFGMLGHRQGSHLLNIQGQGAGMRVRAGAIREEFLRGGPFAEAVHSFLYLQMVQSSQSVLCNRLHSLDRRLARWLLTAADRMEIDEVRITQEYLAQMLGARRSTVTVAAGEMQRQGLIEYVRGRVSIVNRTGLIGAACECYGIIASAYTEVLGRP